VRGSGTCQRWSLTLPLTLGLHQLGDGPDEGVEAVGAFAVREAVGGEVAHLALQIRVFADVGDAALGVENGDRLGAHVFAARGVDLLDGHAGVDAFEGLHQQVAALVGLHDDGVGQVVVIGGDRGLGPGGGIAALDGAITDHIAALVDAQPGDDDAAAVGAGRGGDRRVDGNDDADELGPRQQPALVEIAAPPQAGHAALDDLALELLLTQRRVAVAALHLGEEGSSQVVGIIGGARAADGGGVVLHDALEQRDRPRRGGDDDLRQRAQAQGELQRVPGGVGPAPLAQLVAPGGVELGPAQAVGIIGGKHLGDAAVGPDQLVARGFQRRALRVGMDGKQAGEAFDHHAAHLSDGVADQRDAMRAPVREVIEMERLSAHPFSAGARLAGAASAEHEPGVPGRSRRGGDRRDLVGASQQPPVMDDPVPFLGCDVGGDPGGCIRMAG
jgi:hypothetical protein